MSVGGQTLRYPVVVAMGLAVDLGLALACLGVGVPSSTASGAGLVAGAALNFWLHRNWTFSDTASRPVTEQLPGYIAAVGATLVVRLVAVVGLTSATVGIGDALALVLATGISFAANFLFLRFVFSGRSAP